uniref:coiled-coil domain-containing protein 136-like isoform X1 n=1 Tax=Oncorhynchus gorbuscha TaxID=8017 RepID=UPI001EAF67A9|nr:coiled-coil domain-containing protein 136-like isoform X1 [Oncorhynchus gorbuscha]XP_046185037.1 coiled-coil domain-containing protein 136-like isoform X1 [Oncorhynchus gorbuscha]XP_046185038.1 coiled-coil domain-containing protein 136-like isoform X1 [Oncorhynchus gorbuscha]XP_046185039.1 coiled-coil domain-containing protein 136-like isoform X1 [Oncorhynchus gorbuscha]XP_046185040.1 coiled-coil domain-containing protein 136-like isoform X1 [Oncorhynchus gorbuscha]XP_046185041.1 coiled-coi
MDGLRLPPVIEEVMDPADDICDLKVERPGIVDMRTAKERETLEENDEKQEKGKEVEVGNGEKGQQEDQGEEKEVKVEEEEEVEGGMLEEDDLEELKSQVLQLVLELEEAREVSQQHEESFMEIQGLLEDERLASAHQAESFTRQIQRLQAQLRSVQEEMDSLEEEKESELGEVQEELRSAQEEVLVLQQAGEETAAERENDIASLQEELCRLRAELQRLRTTAQEYEQEITTLRAEISMKSMRREGETDGEVSQLTAECHAISDECQTLKDENKQLSHKLQQLQQQRAGSNDFYLALRGEGDEDQKDEGVGQDEESVKAGGYMTLSQTQGGQTQGGQTQTGKGGRLVDASIQKNISFDGKPITNWNGGPSEVFSLRDQLKLTEERSSQVQRQCEGLKGELAELQGLFDCSQKERAELEQELHHCRVELERLGGRKSQNCTPPSEPPVLSISFIGMIVIMALIWCWWEELAS